MRHAKGANMYTTVSRKLSLLCWFLVLTTACGGIRSISKKTPGGDSPTTSTDPRGDLTKAMRAMLDAKSYRAQMATSTSDGTKSMMILEFVAPDRYHLTRESDLNGKGRYKQDTIIIAEDTWMKL